MNCAAWMQTSQPSSNVFEQKPSMLVDCLIGVKRFLRSQNHVMTAFELFQMTPQDECRAKVGNATSTKQLCPLKQTGHLWQATHSIHALPDDTTLLHDYTAYLYALGTECHGWNRLHTRGIDKTRFSSIVQLPTGKGNFCLLRGLQLLPETYLIQC